MNNNIKSTEAVNFHTLTVTDVLEHFNTGESGLTAHEAATRLDHYGKNELQEGSKKTVWGMFLLQFKDIMIIILLVAAAIAGFMGELADTIIISVVVLINAVLGVAQESKAEKALAALKKMSSPHAKVLRNSEVQLLNTDEIVPGDIVMIEAGDYIPADIRLIEVNSLKIEEAALTGESVPVEKIIDAIVQPDIVTGDKTNMAYLGTSVTYGRGTGVVVATGMSTEVGKIAAHINTVAAEETPLQRKLGELGKYLSIGVVIIAIIIFIAGVLQERDILEMFLTSVSLAVAAIPEGLPAIVTIVLAIGVQKMAKRNSIIRKLSAVETLGSTEIICSDKTGTLTLNKMTVQEIYVGNQMWAADTELKNNESLPIFMQAMVLCNDSIVNCNGNGELNTLGDPTETALIHFASDLGFAKDKLEMDMPRLAEIPFDSDRKLMTTINQVNGINRVITKGAPDVLIDRCTRILINGQIMAMNDQIVAAIKEANHKMALKALRVLALAYKDSQAMIENPSTDETEYDLIFLGLVGMIDPPRKEAQEAVRICKEAGIRAIMITGDHKDTAAAIARELGIISGDDEVLAGNELDKIDEKDFLEQVNRYSVYARVSPEHKVRIVNAWKQNGKVVAMTGDGVNDAPALKAADIGVGMGITGTDVAKGVSDMVLSDDNFATIVLAVEEGRKIYNNIRKAIQFLLSANTGEVLTLFIATMLNWPILYPIHILWINLVTDTFPALALGVEEGEADIMQQKPRSSSASVFAEGVGTNILYQGVFQALLTLSAYYIGISYYSPQTAVTMAFATLGLIQLAHAFNVRSIKHSVFKLGLLTNKYLLGAAFLSAILMVGVIVVPGLSTFFRVEFLTAEQWGIVLLLAILIIPLVELIKLFSRIR
jgi:Ca2+-transporting ATPase